MRSWIIVAVSCLLARGAWGAVSFSAPAAANGDATNTLAENVAVATNVQTLTATTDTSGGSSVAFSIVSVDGDTSSTLFAIGGGSNNELQCKANPGFDYETNTEYVVIVQGLDDGTAPESASVTVTVKITDIDDNESTIQQTCGAVAKVAQSGDFVANAAVCDADTSSSITYAKVTAGSTDAPAFDIDSATGIVTKSATAFADNTVTSYTLIYTATGAANTATGTLTITVGGSCPCLSASSGCSGLSFGLFTLLAALALYKV